MWRYVPALIALAIGSVACAPAPSIGAMTFIDRYDLGQGVPFGDTVIGGLSGISYDPDTGHYLVISDDKGDHGPIRFYTVDITLGDAGIEQVDVLDVVTLEGPTDGVDAEGIAVDAERQRIYWSTEGGRPAGDGEPVDPQPWIRIADRQGRDLGEFLLPVDFGVAAEPGRGIRPNNGLEGLTLDPDGRVLYAGLEEPFYGDPAGLTRITALDVATARAVAQYVYPLDPAPEGRSNGLSDLVALSDTEFLVIERAGGPNPVIRVFRAEIGSATDTLGLEHVSPDVVPMSKTLIADLTAPGIDNIEGITLGPELPDGSRSVLLVSDDNFNPAQVTQFLLYALPR